MLAVSYVLLTNVVYRSQHSPWHLEEYERLDTAYIDLVRKVARFIKGFPSRLITVDRKDGGLGLRSILCASMDRKRKSLLDLVHRKGPSAIAMEGQISRLMRDAGQGGLGPCRRHLWLSLSQSATGLSSLAAYLKTLGLRIRVGWGKMDGWELASTCEQDLEARTELNKRGIVLRSELETGGMIPIRVGQCWLMGGAITEILGFRGEDIETMIWICEGEPSPGKIVTVVEHSQPRGIGGDYLVSKTQLMEKATHLVELDEDRVTDGGEGELRCSIMCLRENRPRDRTVIPEDYMLREWAMWGGGDFTHIYTDGSYKEEANWGEFLLGTPRRHAGGAVIISDGKTWFHRIFVEIDMHVEDAGQVELICLLVANEMARAQGSKVTLGSDCSSAIDIMNGAYSERFHNILAGWKIWENVTTMKIDAHPERFIRHENWNGDEMGIYIADRVAGEFMQAHRKISAKEWMKRISSVSKVSIEEEDGTPFIGSVNRRASMESMRQYLLMRDGYREKEGDFEQKWEGTNMAMAPKLLLRNGGFEDRVTMLKLAAGKRWDVSRHNKATCLLCEEEFMDQRHPLFNCAAYEVYNARQLWKEQVKNMAADKDMWLRTQMEDFVRCVYSERDGELAAVGTYTPRWVEKLDKKKEFSAPQMKKMKRLMGLICRGARVVMRAYTRTCCDKGRDKEDKRNRGIERSQELRQLSISDFTKMGASDAPPGKRKKKAKEVLPLGECEPPQGFLEEIQNDTISIGKWKR